MTHEPSQLLHLDSSSDWGIEMINWIRPKKNRWWAKPNEFVRLVVEKCSHNARQWDARVVIVNVDNLPSRRCCAVLDKQFDTDDEGKAACESALMTFAASMNALRDHLLEPIP